MSPLSRLRALYRRTGDALPVHAVALGLSLYAFLLRLWLLRERKFDPDEFEHLHVAWCISRGLLPYRDFFEHHTPWFHFFLAPFFLFFRVETDVSSAFALIFLARFCMWVFTGALLVATFCLGKQWRDTRTGFTSALLLASVLMFLEKTLEIRPDVLSVGFWLACLICVVRAVRGTDAVSASTTTTFALSGALLGAGVMYTQKLLFALPGLSLAMLWYVLDSRHRGVFRVRLRHGLCQFIGFCAPVGLTLAYFAAHHAFREFVTDNVLLSFRWKVSFPPYDFLQQLVRQNPIFVALSVAGVVRASATMFRGQGFQRAEYVCVLSCLGLCGGLFLIPVPYRQYYLMVLPLGAVFAAGLLTDTLDGAARVREGHWPRRWGLAVGTVLSGALLTAMLIFTVHMAKPRVWGARVYPTLWGVALLGAGALIWARRRHHALALVLIMSSIYPFQQMHEAFRRTNTEALAEIRYVLEHTGPTDTCMDGWTGRGVFRPHAYFFWFLHGEVRAMLTNDERRALLAGLESGAIAPTLIFFDRELERVSPGVAAYLREHYAWVGRGFIWRRKAQRTEESHTSDRTGLLHDARL